MKKTVLFLGAGASKAFHYPLTKDILPFIIERIQHDKLFNVSNKERGNLYCCILKEFLIALSPGLKDAFVHPDIISKTNELPLITDLLSQAEHLTYNNHDILDWNFNIKHPLLGKIESLNERWQIEDAITLLDWAIISVINKGRKSVSRLKSFIEWIQKINRDKEEFVSIITSNYDYSIEWNLLEDGEAYNAHTLIDYGFNWRDVEDGEVYLRPSEPLYKIFKLHGSTDWLQCKRCGFIYVNTCIDIYGLAFSNTKNNANSCHCGYWPLIPVLITPSYIRTSANTNLQQVWRNAFEELRTAEQWMIIGYSMPSEDLDIKSLFLRALKARINRPLIKIVQNSNNSEARFINMFGKSKFEFFTGGFEQHNFQA